MSIGVPLTAIFFLILQISFKVLAVEPENYVQMKYIVFHIGCEFTVVFMHDHSDASHSEAVVIFVRFGSYGQAVLEFQFAVEEIVLLDYKKSVFDLYHKVYNPALLFRNRLDRFKGVVYDVAEKAIEIAVRKEGQLCAVRHTGKIYSALFAEKTLFGNEYV